MTNLLNDEKRNYYRIKDNVGLSYTICSEESEFPDHKDFIAEIPGDYHLITEIKQIDHENNNLLRTIEDKHPELSRYLKVMNSKIEILARHLVTKGLTDDIKIQPVCLSAGGLSFTTNETIPLNTVLKLRIVLYPSCSGILTYAKVVRCEAMEKSDPAQYEVAVKYGLIHETDRDSLVRHAMKLQSNLLRQQKSSD